MSRTIYRNGNIEKRKDGLLHCEDGPAIEYKNGNKEWFLNGVRHREDGPAVEWTCNSKIWIEHGIIKKWYCGVTDRFYFNCEC